MSGLSLKVSVANIRPGAPKAANDFIGNKQDVVFRQHLLDFFEIGARRNNHATSPHDRFGNKGTNSFRAFGLNQVFKLFGQTGGKIFFFLAGCASRQ